MEEVMEMARAKDTKERMAGVERLHQLLESSTKSLSSAEVTALVDCCTDLLKDSNFRVSQGALQALSSAAVLSGEHFKIHFNGLVPAVVERLGDGKQPVRDAARQLLITLMEEMYTNVGPQFREELQRYHLPSSMMKEMNARLEKLEPKVRPSDGVGTHFISTEMKSFTSTQKRNSPKTKSIPRGSLFTGGETDITEKPMDPIMVYSEKELFREIEKIASTLVPEKDWSLRIAAMQRVEGLVFGGAVDYPSFPMLLKQLVGPLSTQLSDRRSSIVKQACHLLCLLSKELLGDFEACAEMFIPVLFKLVVITVLVIAESADNCIKTMLRNCKVARVLPRIADTAKNDRSAVLRARCCEYALLVLEYWADAPEIQRSADLYEDLIKCCVADAMSEIINDEDGGMHKRYASPSLRERGTQISCAPSHASTPSVPGYGTSAIVAMDRSASITSGTSLSSGSLLLSQSKPLGKGSDRSLESMLHASKQKVSAIESLLRGVNIPEKHNSSISHSTSLDLGVDSPSARDPPFPLAVPASNNLSMQHPVLVDSTTANTFRGGMRNGGSNLTDLTNPKAQASRDLSKFSYASHLSSDSLSALSLPYMKRSSEGLQEGSALEDNADVRSSRRLPNMHIDRQCHEAPYRDSGYRDVQSNYVPNFQRPLLRKQVTGRASASGRSSFDDGQILVSEMSTYMDGPASLNDALTEGLSPSSDWVTRVSAFSYLRTLLQQGPKGIQEVTQSFEKVMKLFFRHLDDPHHKVAQAALSTLAEIIPACRKHFESYLERILPHVFSRLIDPKELVRQPSSTTLEIVGSTYTIDSLLPALLRSLDEQRSPKAKLAVVHFANNSFNKYALNSDGCSNSSFLKLWLAKLAPLVNGKNTKLKEASTSGIISIYSHFDSTAVLNFILSLSVEDQNSLRRALKQYTPRIEVDLVNLLQNKKDRQRPKSFYDQSDNIGTSSEEGYVVTLKKGPLFGRCSAGSVDSEGGRKRNSVQESSQPDASIVWTASDETQQHSYQTVEVSSDMEVLGPKISELKLNTNSTLDSVRSRTIHIETDSSLDHENSVTIPCLDINRLVSSDGDKATGLTRGGEVIRNIEITDEKLNSAKNSPRTDNGPSIPQLLLQICNGNDANASVNKHEALQRLIEASVVNDSSIWMKYFNQILTAVLEVLDDSDSSTRELALSLIVEMLKNQKQVMEDSVEIVIEKLLHATKDMVAKVSNEAQQCLNIVLAQYDPFRCLSVVVPLLVSDDEKTLVICINCLTKCKFILHMNCTIRPKFIIKATSLITMFTINMFMLYPIFPLSNVTIVIIVSL
ncbi:CLIP-associated protein [Cocos nucifera]|uniref:CLIP-associated protein n=1 Tax=Cocos nucifera TaxID=13894 RepID=A0A8K0IFC5_COCNU|nr:CLIP-associated protein [Cocos nucifera]